jgi:hypothetical protein
VIKYKNVALQDEAEPGETEQISRQIKLEGFEPVRKGDLIPFEAV